MNRDKGLLARINGGVWDRYSRSMVDVIGDCPNLKVPVPPEVFWKTIESKEQWKCQKNIIFNTARVIDDRGMRVANGSVNVMKEKLKRLTDSEFLKKGDVIGVSRGAYEHYGIYIGDNKVIHFCGEQSNTHDFGGNISIHEADMKEFLKGSSRYFVVWFDDGMPVKIQNKTSFTFYSVKEFYSKSYQIKKRHVYTPEETVERAKRRIGEKNYNFLVNNCEHFAMWCKTGVAECSQVEQMVRYAVEIGINGYGITAEVIKTYCERIINYDI